MKWYSVWMVLKVAFSNKSSAVQSKFKFLANAVHFNALKKTPIQFLNRNNIIHRLSNRDGFFAAASCMSFQQCRFNFGSEPFKYPPKSRSFDSFNSHAVMKAQDKIVLPRHLFLEQLRKMSVREDSCTLCFDAKGIVRLEPCTHRYGANKQTKNGILIYFMTWFPFITWFIEIWPFSQSIPQRFLYDMCIAAATVSTMPCYHCVTCQRRKWITYKWWSIYVTQLVLSSSFFKLVYNVNVYPLRDQKKTPVFTFRK